MEKEVIISLSLAGFATIISLTALIWNIVRSIIEKQPKIKVEAKLYQRLASNDIKGTEFLVPVLTMKAINTGNRNIHIDRIYIETDKENKKGDRKFQQIERNRLIEYPVEIEMGSVFEHNFDLSILYNNFINKFNFSVQDSFRILVQDTLGNTYKSKKIKIQSIGQALELYQSEKEAETEESR